MAQKQISRFPLNEKFSGHVPNYVQCTYPTLPYCIFIMQCVRNNHKHIYSSAGHRKKFRVATTGHPVWAFFRDSNNASHFRSEIRDFAFSDNATSTTPTTNLMQQQNAAI